jgi:hypothetical protein
MRAPASALTTAHENASHGILVVQARRLGSLPGKVPAAAAPLTGDGAARMLGPMA